MCFRRICYIPYTKRSGKVFYITHVKINNVSMPWRGKNICETCAEIKYVICEKSDFDLCRLLYKLSDWLITRKLTKLRREIEKEKPSKYFIDVDPWYVWCSAYIILLFLATCLLCLYTYSGNILVLLMSIGLFGYAIFIYLAFNTNIVDIHYSYTMGEACEYILSEKYVPDIETVWEFEYEKGHVIKIVKEIILRR